MSLSPPPKRLASRRSSSVSNLPKREKTHFGNAKLAPCGDAVRKHGNDLAADDPYRVRVER